MSTLKLSELEINEFNELLIRFNPDLKLDHSFKLLNCIETKSLDLSTPFKIKLYECENSITLEHLDQVNLILGVAEINLKNKYEAIYSRFRTEFNLQTSVADANAYLKRYGFKLFKYIQSALFIRNDYADVKICGHPVVCNEIFSSFIDKEAQLLQKENIDEIIQECYENFENTFSRMMQTVGLREINKYEIENKLSNHARTESIQLANSSNKRKIEVKSPKDQRNPHNEKAKSKLPKLRKVGRSDKSF